jgi:PTH1 family peptidyl-tRNA hydrolase
MCTKMNYAADIYLIAGLGNPGKEYRQSRHNVGFMVIDHLAEDLEISIKRVKFKAMIGIGKFENKQVILVKPQTYMNASGESIAPLLRYFKIPLENFIVVHDDLDIPFGNLRIRPSGGTSGQKGMKSIVEKLGSQDFPRMRMGIGRPPGRMDPVDYVLQSFTPDQVPIMEEVLDQAVKALKTFILDGLDKAMNTYNGDKGIG